MHGWQITNCFTQPTENNYSRSYRQSSLNASDWLELARVLVDLLTDGDMI